MTHQLAFGLGVVLGALAVIFLAVALAFCTRRGTVVTREALLAATA